MRIPGFSAEASLDQSSGHHCTFWIGTPLGRAPDLSSVQIAFGWGAAVCLNIPRAVRIRPVSPAWQVQVFAAVPRFPASLLNG